MLRALRGAWSIKLRLFARLFPVDLLQNFAGGTHIMPIVVRPVGWVRGAVTGNVTRAGYFHAAFAAIVAEVFADAVFLVCHGLCLQLVGCG